MSHVMKMNDPFDVITIFCDLGNYLDARRFNEVPRHANHVCLFCGITSLSGHPPLDI